MFQNQKTTIVPSKDVAQPYWFVKSTSAGTDVMRGENFIVRGLHPVVLFSNFFPERTLDFYSEISERHAKASGLKVLTGLEELAELMQGHKRCPDNHELSAQAQRFKEYFYPLLG